MGTQARIELARLAKRYARHFKVPEDEVQTRELPEDCEVFCPSRPELPVWSLGYNN